ncbi:TPA: tandem-95 repeat protein [Pseudomonas aeruginosa]
MTLKIISLGKGKRARSGWPLTGAPLFALLIFQSTASEAASCLYDRSNYVYMADCTYSETEICDGSNSHDWNAVINGSRFTIKGPQSSKPQNWGSHAFTAGGKSYYFGSSRSSAFSGNWTEYELCGEFNSAPTVANRSLTTAEDATGSIALSATDPDAGDTHTFTIITSPGAEAGTASIAGSTLLFYPKPNWNGSTSLTYRATDSKGAVSNTATVTITVTPVNDPPVAQAKTLTTDEDTSGSVVLTATDIDSPAPTIFQIVTQPNAAHGNASLSGSTLTFNPARDWNGTTTLTYRAQDSSGAWSAPAVVTIIVRLVNDPPAVAGRSITTAEDTPATLTLSASDIDSSSFTFEVVSQPGHGFASIYGGKLTYTPPEDWYGTTSLTYRAKDDAGAWSNVATIAITVTPVNDPPVALPLTLTLPEDTPGAVTLKATDIDSLQTFVFEMVTPPSAVSGSASIQGDRLLFTPAVDWNGTTSVSYRAKDLEGAWSAPTVVTVVVTPVNDQPTQAGRMVTRTTESVPVVTRGSVSN